MFKILMGIPEIENFWNDLETKISLKKANKSEIDLYNKLGKAFYHLSFDPKYPSLKTHEIEELSRRYLKKVWESYVENRKPNAYRIFWTYGKNKDEIVIIGIEPHPNDKNNSYSRITLSSLPKE